MTTDPQLTAETTIRRVRPEEWGRVRALRLDALRDPVAHLAFVETLAEAEARPEEFWQERAERASHGGAAAQFVAEDAAGDLLGSTTVLITEPGAEDVLGDTTDARRALVVGVFVRAAGRGSGLVDRLLDAAAVWVEELGVDSVTLLVHPENHRARAAYLRCGYVDTGAPRELQGVPHVEMRREIQAGATGRFS